MCGVGGNQDAIFFGWGGGGGSGEGAELKDVSNVEYKDSRNCKSVPRPLSALMLAALSHCVSSLCL